MFAYTETDSESNKRIKKQAYYTKHTKNTQIDVQKSNVLNVSKNKKQLKFQTFECFILVYIKIP